jgi:hypothetical protein
MFDLPPPRHISTLRVSPVGPRPSEGPLPEPTAGAQSCRRERVLLPRSRHPSSPSRTTRSGGKSALPICPAPMCACLQSGRSRRRRSEQLKVFGRTHHLSITSVDGIVRGRRGRRAGTVSCFCRACAWLPRLRDYRPEASDQQPPARAARPSKEFRCFLLFLQEIISDGSLLRRRNPRFLSVSRIKEQRDSN